MLLCFQVPCAFTGGVKVRIDNFRTSGGGWVRMLFKNVNGSPVDKAELAKVRAVLCVAIAALSA